ncbi:MAG: KamA family radical SAM protein [archaeon]
MKWRKKLKKENIVTIDELKKYVSLSKKQEKLLKKAADIHPMSITKYYFSLIDWKDKNDPIKNLVVPSEDELDLHGIYDTSGEHDNTKSVGLQHKYAETALLLSTNRCAAYCRFCFRKRLVGLSNEEILKRFDEAVKYIKEHTEINNVLISGGDPLTLPTEVIEKLLKMLSRIDHLDFIRFGSRVPVVFPERISKDRELLALFKKYSTKKRRIYIVTHFNHPREITFQSINGIDSLIKSNVIVNNQTVLLKGVNDDSEVLAELMNKLVSIGVNPYYVFQCRPVKRVVHHFQVPFYYSCRLVDNARKKLNGHAKRFKFVMSHKRGKIEILGIKGKYILFKQHQAKDPELIGQIFKRKLDRTSGWLNDSLKMY